MSKIQLTKPQIRAAARNTLLMRSKHSFNQRQLAEAAKLHAHWDVSVVESGKRNAPGKIERIAKYFGYTLTDFLTPMKGAPSLRDKGFRSRLKGDMMSKSRGGKGSDRAKRTARSKPRVRRQTSSTPVDCFEIQDGPLTYVTGNGDGTTYFRLNGIEFCIVSPESGRRVSITVE